MTESLKKCQTDPLVAMVRRLVEPHGLHCCAVSGHRYADRVRVYAHLPDRRGSFIAHDFQRNTRILGAVKGWLGAERTRRKLAVLREARERVAA